jgi:hypothetical protein
MFRFLHVVGDHVEDHLELCLVQASHHLLELGESEIRNAASERRDAV